MRTHLWDGDKIRRLMDYIAEGLTAEAIAARFNESATSVRVQCSLLGMRLPTRPGTVSNGVVTSPNRLTYEDLKQLPPLSPGAGYIARRQANVAFLIELKRAGHEPGAGERRAEDES